MKKHLIFLVLALVLTLCGSALAEYGYVDDQGNTVVEPMWDKANTYSCGLGLVASDNSGKTIYAYLTLDGEVLGGMAFEDAKDFMCNRAAVRVNGKWGFIDTTGAFAVLPQYESVYSYANGYAVGYKGSTYYLLDLRGQVVQTYSGRIYDVNSGRARVEKGSRQAYMNVETGEVYGDYAEAKDYRHGYAAVKNSSGKWGVVDVNGTLVVDYKYTSLYVMSEHAFVAKTNSSSDYHVVEMSTGTTIKSYDYVSVSFSPAGYTYAYNGPMSSYGPEYSAETGDYYILSPYGTVSGGPITIRDCYTVTDESWRVKMKGAWGIVSVTGETIMPPTYERLYYATKGGSTFCMAQKGGKYGVVAMDGTPVGSFKWNDAAQPMDGRAKVKGTSSKRAPDLASMLVTSAKVPSAPNATFADVEGLTDTAPATPAAPAPAPATPAETAPAPAPAPAAPAANPDFRKLTWGMTQEQVEAIEGATLTNRQQVEGKDAWTCDMTTTVTGKPCTIRFFFCGDGLYRAIYYFTTAYENPSDFIPDYEAFSASMVRKYGEPLLEQELWDTSSHKTTYTGREAEAFNEGYLEYVAMYFTENSCITISLSQQNEHSPFIVLYESNDIVPQDVVDYSDEI